MVRRPSVRLSVCPIYRAAGLLLGAPRTGDIDRLVTRHAAAARLLLWRGRQAISIDNGGRRVPSSTARCSKFEQCHVVSLRGKLKTNLLNEQKYISLGWLGSRVVSVLDSGAEGPGFISQSRPCRVTVLGKMFTPIVPLFTKQQNW